MKSVRPRSKPRSTYHHHDLRNALLAAALEMLEREGTANFTLRELARRSGVSHAAPYAHYSDKAALLADVARIGFERLGKSLSAAATESDPRTRFLATGQAYVAFAFAHPALYRLMFGPELPAIEECSPVFAAAADIAFEVLVATLRELPFRGKPRAPGRVRGDAIAAWAHVHGLTLLALDRRVGASAGERSALIEIALGALVDGIAPQKW